MKLPFRARIITGFILTLIVITVMGFYAYWSTQRLIVTGRLWTHATAVRANLTQLLVTMIDFETGQRGFIITGDRSYLQPYDSALQNLDKQLAALHEMTDDLEQQKTRAIQLEKMIGQRIAIAKDIIEVRNESFEKAQAMIIQGEGKKAMDGIRRLIREIQQIEDESFAAKSRVNADTLVQFQIAFVSLLIIPAIIITLLFYWILSHFKARSKAEADSRRAAVEIHQLNKELESYTYSVSHDLRAPLRSIDGYSQILKEDYYDKLDDEGKRVIGVIMNNAKRMGNLIDDLLDFSRMGRKEIHKSEMDVDDLVRTVIDELTEPRNGKNADIRVLPLGHVKGDINMMRQVWLNLISNAIKYSGLREDPKIEIGSYMENGAHCFYVKDNGVGFNMDYKDKLFGVFQRLHKVNEFEGTGVGLALVKRIVTRHGGTIWAEAKVNEGATFYFSLPA
jgi:signal transduction histidine kinase